MKHRRNTLAYRGMYRRRLPHIQPAGAILFVTFRLAGSLPVALVREMQERALEERRAVEEMKEALDEDAFKARLDKQHRREFGRWDRALDRQLCGPVWLEQQEVAQVVVNSLHWEDGARYELHAYCVMPNHVHVLMRPLESVNGESVSLASILHTMKGYRAKKCNEKLGRHGQFWQHESYDHVVRDDGEWERIVNYILLNPVKAGLAQDVEAWPRSYYVGR